MLCLTGFTEEAGLEEEAVELQRGKYQMFQSSCRWISREVRVTGRRRRGYPANSSRMFLVGGSQAGSNPETGELAESTGEYL